MARPTSCIGGTPPTHNHRPFTSTQAARHSVLAHVRGQDGEAREHYASEVLSSNCPHHQMFNSLIPVNCVQSVHSVALARLSEAVVCSQALGVILPMVTFDAPPTLPIQTLVRRLMTQVQLEDSLHVMP